MKAFVTLLSSKEYLSAVLVLNAALKRVKSKYKLVCAVDNIIISDTIKQILDENNIICEIVPHLDYPSSVKSVYNSARVNNTATKLQIFSLVKYEKLVYIDSDVLVLHNIDNLFDKPSGAMAVMSDLPTEGFSGLFVFNPNQYDINNIYNMLNFSYGLDGDIIPKIFNFTVTQEYKIDDSFLYPFSKFNTLTQYAQQAVKVIHFCNDSQKPWMKEFKNNAIELNIYAKLIKKFSYFINKYGGS